MKNRGPGTLVVGLALFGLVILLLEKRGTSISSERALSPFRKTMFPPLMLPSDEQTAQLAVSALTMHEPVKARETQLETALPLLIPSELALSPLPKAASPPIMLPDEEETVQSAVDAVTMDEPVRARETLLEAELPLLISSELSHSLLPMTTHPTRMLPDEEQTAQPAVSASTMHEPIKARETLLEAELPLSISSELSHSPLPKTTPPPRMLPDEEQTAQPAVSASTMHEPIKAERTKPKAALPFPIPTGKTSFKALQNNQGLLTRTFDWIRTQSGRSSTKRLQVSATVSLGEKRFVAVIQVDEVEFLIGGGATNVSLLSQLDKKESFDHLLTKSMAAPQEGTAELAVEQTRKLA